MIINKELQKQYAIEAMRKLDIYPAYINAFKAKRQRVCEFDNYGGFYIDENSPLAAKIREIEEDTGCMVFAVTHSAIEDAETYEFLLVSAFEEDMPRTVEIYDERKAFVLAYVENLDYPDCSDMGMVAIHYYGGGVRRIG